jgi:hypothetical protein
MTYGELEEYDIDTTDIEQKLSISELAIISILMLFIVLIMFMLVYIWAVLSLSVL